MNEDKNSGIEKVRKEAERCLNCKNPQCMTGCPVSNRIPEFIQAFLNDDIEKAAELIFERNPLSVICSRVCPYEKQCQAKCILGKKNSPVNISLIEKYISNLYLEKDIEILEEPKEQMIAVIGSGPSGMTVAHQLIKKCTTRPGVFGCGDVVRGTSTVVEAVRCGKLTSQAIDKYLKNLKRGVTDWPIELDTET